MIIGGLAVSLSGGTPCLHAQLTASGATASFRGSLPPKASVRLEVAQTQALRARLDKVSADFDSVRQHRYAADVDIFLKAVRYALEYEEWYDKKAEESFRKAAGLLDEAEKRIEGLKNERFPWLEGSGSLVVGFYSKIDGSPQPYGIEIPEGLVVGRDQPAVPMWIWLHGRGDTSTDLHFIHNRLHQKKPGQFQPLKTLVIHPFGRYCNGWKSAGETDVFEARDDAIARFHVDSQRIALAGFSMGGAGAWHLGAHFADQWACVHAGAGFVDVQRYQKLTPDKLPPWYEQKLWGVYDVPKYARNFLNVPLIAYSGENDAQRDAAEYMMEVLAVEGLQPPHLIGPEMGHKYHPEVIKEVQRTIEQAVAQGRPAMPTKLSLQTRTLAYSRLHWLQITGMERQWEDARVDAQWNPASHELRLSTKNVRSLAIHLPDRPRLTIDGRPAQLQPLATGGWRWLGSDDSNAGGSGTWEKRPGLQGPIDDAFRSSFVVVLPDLPTADNAIDRWVTEEASRFLTRWPSLMRGDVPVKSAKEITADDMKNHHLVLWGTPQTNSLLARATSHADWPKPIEWNQQTIRFGEQSASASSHVPVFVLPNPMHPQRYLVVNSGLTFREAHDRTNSLQNPKLPDWAILDITAPPNNESAGKVVAADFFGEAWEVLPRRRAPEDRGSE
jgi:pimeloyl-ACP methyl ester carboxylesterase